MAHSSCRYTYICYRIIIINWKIVNTNMAFVNKLISLILIRFLRAHMKRPLPSNMNEKKLITRFSSFPKTAYSFSNHSLYYKRRKTLFKTTNKGFAAVRANIKLWRSIRAHSISIERLTHTNTANSKHIY